MKKRQTQDWAALLLEQEQSGKSIADFCKDKGIHYSSLYKHRKIIQDSKLVEIKVKHKPESQSTEAPIVLNYREFSIKVPSCFNKQSLTDVISVLVNI